ncbi:MAG: hypothetical protein LKK51_02225 [Eubacterium sp.]|jgi:hypothetical protein|nr:hypothetical protein [Eubacterium sp.]
MGRIRRSSEQALELKIEQARARVVRTREAHEKAVDGLKKLLDIQKEQQNTQIMKALEKSERSFEEIMRFITTPASEEEA